jgi:hypothetical protein
MHTKFLLLISVLLIACNQRKTDSSSIRRIRILPRPNPGGSIATKIYCPQEISEIKPGQVCSATVCIEFASVSNRDGDLIGRLDVKSATGGGVPVQIKPSMGELLQPAPKKLRKAADFDATRGVHFYPGSGRGILFHSSNLHCQTRGTYTRSKTVVEGWRIETRWVSSSEQHFSLRGRSMRQVHRLWDYNCLLRPCCGSQHSAEFDQESHRQPSGRSVRR